MTALDITVIVLYFALVLGIGAYFAPRQAGPNDYFLGRRGLPWWAVMLSIVATETSALTVISVPGLAARGNLTFLQLSFGYLVGRIGVAAWLLPGYFRGEQETAYARLEGRFGPHARRAASGVFMVVRALGDSVRVFATAIPLAVVTGWSVPASIVVITVVTLAYTVAGGLKAVVWVDALQLAIYVLGGIATLVVAAQMAGGFGTALGAAAEAGKLQVISWDLSFSTTYTVLGGLIGGALLSAASHGTDHLIVQRLLATPSLRDARRALVVSGVVVIAQFALFLLLGTMLWAAHAAGSEAGAAGSGDAILPRFVVSSMPSGLAGFVVAGILAAAMSSSLSALASATAHDFYAPLTGRRDEKSLLSVGRWATILWAMALGGGALVFRGGGQPVVELALSIASITYGGLLGTYILSGIAPRAREPQAIIAIVTTTLIMLVVVLLKPVPFAHLAWPWYVPMGTAIAVAVGYLTSLGGTAGGQTGRRADGRVP